MAQVREIMTKAPVTVNPWASVREAALLMAQHRVGSLPVLQNGVLLGVITSRDLRGVHPNRVVLDVLKGPPLCLPPEASLLEARALMEEKGVERLLVVKEGQLLGLLTKRTLAFALGQRFDPLTGLPRPTSCGTSWSAPWVGAWTPPWSSQTWTISGGSTSAWATPSATGC
ncbi:CBS domain-containing protein [Thermus tenuipuniceus]|uniref:CBS domain-containing protein n=1 Tax=Thermus tenuipuniceus TaxID=2078690 RepID=UPI001FC932B7|nr:CBS domain-containing protein [Thermus tenuipuniceus]